MSEQIKVSAEFLADFKEYCTRINASRIEIDDLKVLIRSDFNKFSVWIIKQVKIMKFIDATWGSIPTTELMQGYLAGMRYWAEDELIFKRWGVMLLAELCYDIRLKSDAL